MNILYLYIYKYIMHIVDLQRYYTIYVLIADEEKRKYAQVSSFVYAIFHIPFHYTHTHTHTTMRSVHLHMDSHSMANSQ